MYLIQNLYIKDNFITLYLKQTVSNYIVIHAPRDTKARHLFWSSDMDKKGGGYLK